jgi:hypothetical protein
MRIPGTRHLDNERGATLVFVAVALIALLSMVALAVDYGMLASARADAQRAADASALAGASTYMDALPDPVTAEERALDWAQRNHLLGNAVQAVEVSVTVDDPESTVNVLVERRFPLFFARIFGFETAPISAFASARVTTSGSAACIKPFGISDGLYTDDDVFREVLIWESKGNADKDAGESNFLVIGTPESPRGVGHDIYHMLMDASCSFSNISIGDTVPAQPSENIWGNVRKGLTDLEKENGGELTCCSGPYDGFNKPDWESDSRVALIPIYAPESIEDGYVTITGFLRLVVDTQWRTCNNNTGPSCNNPESSGNQRQVYAWIIPSPGLTDTCTGSGCSDLNRTLQLVR